MNQTSERTLAEQLAANPELRIENPPRAGDPWSRYEDEILRRLYSTRDVPNLSWVLGRSPGAIRDRLKTLGLTGERTSTSAAAKSARAATPRRGHRVTTQAAAADARPPRSGKRDDLGGLYVRSAWEANYARYLNWLKANKQIAGWEYEPHTFIFHGETRGAITYTPDFRITYPGGRTEYVEIKGWMDAKSKSRHKKMAKYYPGVVLIMITEKEYRTIERQVSSLIPGWERSRPRSTR